jgi:hypothetical protein
MKCSDRSMWEHCSELYYITTEQGTTEVGTVWDSSDDCHRQMSLLDIGPQQQCHMFSGKAGPTIWHYASLELLICLNQSPETEIVRLKWVITAGQHPKTQDPTVMLLHSESVNLYKQEVCTVCWFTYTKWQLINTLKRQQSLLTKGWYPLPWEPNLTWCHTAYSSGTQLVATACNHKTHVSIKSIQLPFKQCISQTFTSILPLCSANIYQQNDHNKQNFQPDLGYVGGHH